MAHSLSSKKRMRQNVTRRMRNRARSSALRKKLRTCREHVMRGNIESAESSYLDAVRALDREACRRTLHRNAAARRKSRLAKRINALKAKAAAN